MLSKFPGWTRQVLSIAGLTYASQLLSLAVLPWITNRFSPEQFGYYAAYNSTVALTAVFCTWRYYLAIALPNDHSSGKDVFWGCIAILSAMSVAITLGVSVINSYKESYPPEVAHLAELVSIFLPAGFYLTGIHLVSTNLLLRLEKGHYVGIAFFLQTLVALTTQISLSYTTFDGSRGLIVGTVCGQLTSIVYLILIIKKKSKMDLRPNTIKSIRVIKKYAHLPRSLLQTELLNVIGKRSLPIILTSFYDPRIAGYWSICQTVLGNTTGVITSAIWQVSHNRLAQLKPNMRKLTLANIHYFSCFIFTLPLFLVISFKDFVPFLLGNQWANVVTIIPVFALMIMVNSISNVSSYFVVFGKYKQEKFYNTLLVLLPLSAVLFGANYFNGISAIYVFCCISTILYFGLNIYWGSFSNNLHGFLTELFKSLGINFLAFTIITFVAEKSISISILFAIFFTVLYFTLTIRDRFAAINS